MAENSPTIRLGDLRLKQGMQGGQPIPISRTTIRQYPLQTIEGNPTFQDKQIVQDWIWSDCSGGAGVYRHTLNTSLDRYWDLDGLWPMFPGRLTLAPLVEEVLDLSLIHI